MAVDYWIDEDGLGIEVYDDGGHVFISWSEFGCIACVKVTYTEGQFDED